MKKLSYNKEHNYLAKVIKIENLRKHSNADRLFCISVDGNNVITDENTKENDIYVYFPLECSINLEFLKFSNSFRDKELNNNKEEKGFFEKHGRVKALLLRGERSEGYIVPVSSIEKWFMHNGQNLSISESDVDTYFDTILNIKMCKKYVSKRQTREDNKNKKVKKEKIIVSNQFRLSEDTPQLGKSVHELKDDDIISITKKLHGANFSVGKVKCLRKLNLFEKFLKNIIININEEYYDIVYASRKIIKGTLIKGTLNRNNYYDVDIWKIVAEKLKDVIHDNMTIYGEIVGFTPSGSYIQKNYDYGCKEKETDFYVYRITLTTNDGRPYDFSWAQVKSFCSKMGIKHVPELYYGSVKNLNVLRKDFSNDKEWSEHFLKFLRTYLEKKCTICQNDVWDEGIVISKDDLFFKKFKFKSFSFLKNESEILDAGYENIDESDDSNDSDNSK